MTSTVTNQIASLEEALRIATGTETTTAKLTGDTGRRKEERAYAAKETRRREAQIKMITRRIEALKASN